MALSRESHRATVLVPVDRTALKVNQALIVSLLSIAFVLNLPLLVGLVAVVMVLGTWQPQWALFQQLYHRWLKPTGRLKPDVQHEALAPHRFAQGLGGAVLVVASLALLLGAHLLGWILALIVVALAAINLGFGFCAGCFVYFQLARWRGARHA
ncbi:MAG: DUF4395 domain-containing protein [Oscillochloridaceae bacterium umkhey_bin13]